MLPRASLALALALVSLLPLVSGQLRQTDALLTWYAEPACSPGIESLVVVLQGACQLVPAPLGAYVGYKTTCSADGSSVISYCTDSRCESCPITQAVRKDECIPNDAVHFGSASLGVTCPAPGTGDILLPAVENLLPGTAELGWFGRPGCGLNPANVLYRTIVVATQGLCHRVPSTNSASGLGLGYRFLCNGDGSGVYQTCLDSECAVCTTTAPFYFSQMCMSNPSRYGSESLTVRCPGIPPPPIVPFVPASPPARST